MLVKCHAVEKESSCYLLRHVDQLLSNVCMLRVGSIQLEVEAAALRVEGQLQAQPHDSHTLLQTLHTHPSTLNTPPCYALSCKRNRKHLTDRRTDGRTDRQTDKLAGRQADRQTDRQAGRLTDRQTGTQTDRQTDRERETEGKMRGR